MGLLVLFAICWAQSAAAKDCSEFGLCGVQFVTSVTELLSYSDGSRPIKRTTVDRYRIIGNFILVDEVSISIDGKRYNHDQSHVHGNAFRIDELFDAVHDKINRKNFDGGNVRWTKATLSNSVATKDKGFVLNFESEFLGKSRRNLSNITKIIGNKSIYIDVKSHVCRLLNLNNQYFSGRSTTTETTVSHRCTLRSGG
jgi:hypothetical protein